MRSWLELKVYKNQKSPFFSLRQVVSMGLYLGERAYLRSSWNILDGFLVFVSLIDIVVSMAGGAKILGVLRVLRLLRTLRPLRLEDWSFARRSPFGSIHFLLSVFVSITSSISSSL